MLKDDIRNLLRSPIDLKPLRNTADNTALQTDDGRKFPIMNGIVCLLQEGERGVDVGDGKFYDTNPFGERDWKDVADVEAGVEKELKALLSQLPRLARIIDVGCGSGRISNYLDLKGFSNVVSLDFSLPSLKIVSENSKNACIWGNNLHLPFESRSFDLVISSGVLHHTPDPHAAFSECLRILKGGGYFYVRLYNRYSLYGLLYFTYGAVLRFLARYRGTRFLSDLFGFQIYKIARQVLFNLAGREDRVLRAKFGNLFLKDMVYFFTTSEIKGLLDRHQMDIVSGKKLNLTHRMHCYVAKKKT